MRKQSLFLALAAGLLVNLAFVTSSQAGSTVLTVDSLLGTIPSGVTSITGVEVTFSGVPSFSDLTVVVPKGATASVSGDTVDITIPSNASDGYMKLGQAVVWFTFAVPTNAALGVQATSTLWQTNGAAGPAAAGGTSAVLLDPPQVPEPASMSLLGIGMAGLVAFRRYFRRNPNVRS